MHTNGQVRKIVDSGAFYECPRWNDGRWWISDFHRHAVLTMAPGGKTQLAATVDGQPAGLGWLPDGTLLIASMKDRRLLQLGSDGSLSEYADLSAHCRGYLNDMVVDSLGRAYVGNFGYDVAGKEKRADTSLVRVDPDGTVVAVGEDLSFPNGTVITPEGGTLIVAETMACRMSAFSIAADGSLTDRRVWAQMAPTPEPDDDVPVGLDGCCLDAEGAIWVADAFGRRCLRIAEGGEVLQEITVEGYGLYACMLGGADGRTLLLCAAPNFGEANRRNAHDAALFVVDVDIPHAGLP